MKRRPRVLLVGRHFWPHGSHDSAAALYQLARGLSRQNVHVDVVTPKHSVSWSDQCRLGGFVVHRPTVLPRRDWSFARYSRYLAAWICQHVGGYDVIIADSMREEAAAVVEAATTLGCGSIVTDAGVGPHGDQAWASRTRTAKKTWSLAARADRILSTSVAGHRGLIAKGCPPERIVRRATGFESLPPVTPMRKTAARNTLAETNLDLHADADASVILAVGRMTGESGLRTVVENAYWMLSRYSRAKLWLIGDGPARDAMHQDLKANGVRSAIAMPGTFTTLTDVFCAADLLIQADGQGTGYYLPAAVAHGLPLVVVDTPEHRDLLTVSTNADRAITWFSPPIRKPQAVAINRLAVQHKPFRDAVKRPMDDLSAAKAAADAVHRDLVRTSPYQAALDQITSLVAELAVASQPKRKAE